MMRTLRWLRTAMITALALGGIAAEAQDATCTRTLGDTRVRGNLNVTARCELNGTDVRGDVTLFAGGALIARNARIRGSVTGSRADFVSITRTRIDGAVDLRELVGDRSTIERSDLRGDVLLANNRSRLELLNNDLRRDLQARGNTGGVWIAGNSLGGDLLCSGNDPGPLGLGNRVEGDAQGQCARLEPRPAETPPSQMPPSTTPPPPTTSRPPPTTSTPPPTTSSPPPTTSTPPPTTSSPPPPTSTPPTTTSSPPATPVPTPPNEPDSDPSLGDGGAGAAGWPFALLLPLLAWRRFARRPQSSA